jgi:hypothetical protein
MINLRNLSAKADQAQSDPAIGSLLLATRQVPPQYLRSGGHCLRDIPGRCHSAVALVYNPPTVNG